jgi:ribonuclease E
VAEEAVAQEGFVDTLPGAGSPEGGEASGERQGGRRRNRRGGRGGRDRDEGATADTDNVQPGQPAPAEHAEASSAEPPESAISNDGDLTAEAPRTEGGELGEGRRRGRGRDRNRRDRAPQVGAQAGPEDGTASSEGLIQGGALATEAFQEAEAETVAPITTAAEPAMAGVAAVDIPATEAVAAPMAPQAPIAPTLPVASAPPEAAPAPTAPSFVLPLDSLQAVAESAGLQWVNSDAEKIRAVQAAMASESAPVHVPRERKPAAAVDEGPLVLVETRKDLSQFKLPFENAQGSQPQG